MKFKTLCERIRENNGLVEVFFTRRHALNDHGDHDECVLINVKRENCMFRQGEYYWVEIVSSLPN